MRGARGTGRLTTELQTNRATTLVRSAGDWENLTRVGVMKKYCERLGQFGKPDEPLATKPKPAPKRI
jgi:hypothetical protein